MRIHDIPGDPGRKQNPKRVGRGDGSGHGGTSGRGHKGAKARSGARITTQYEGGQMPLIRRIPKRGFTNRFKAPYTTINIATLEKVFAAGSVIDPAILVEKRLIKKSEQARVKILGQGDVTKGFTVKAHAFSNSAMEKIKAAGGQCEVIPC
ncbi:MAG TPA: 50S ribosomal protein L15 [Candidatus Sumerlaeota bacterium]|nr:50S ribosomal protein L15 [Candidatus Sumerlaeota bacterium]